MHGYAPPYDETYATLNVQLNPSTGRLDVSQYTSVTAGGKTLSGYLATAQVQEGSTGTPVTVRSYTYTPQTAGSGTTTSWVVLRNQSSEYPNGSTVATNFDFTFYTVSGNATVQVETKKTKPPIVPSGQNGDGIQYAVLENRDLQNRVYYRTDPYNFTTPPTFIPSVNTIFDEPTGAAVRSIRNASATETDLTSTT